jgi:hypothetical protein
LRAALHRAFGANVMPTLFERSWHQIRAGFDRKAAGKNVPAFAIFVAS